MKRSLIVLLTFFPLLIGGITGGCASELSFPGNGRVSEEALISWPVPQIMARALEFAHDRYAMNRDMVINLPTGSPVSLYDAVQDRLASTFPDTRPLTDNDPYGFHLTTMHVRDLDATVDVIYPRPENVYELVTLTLRRSSAHGYQVQSSRLWRIQVNVPEPTYVVPPPVLEPPDLSPPDLSIPDLDPVPPLSLPPATEPATTLPDVPENIENPSQSSTQPDDA